MFIEFGLIDIIDIFLVALMLFYIYRLMRESRSLNVFIGIMVFVVIWLSCRRSSRCACLAPFSTSWSVWV